MGAGFSFGRKQNISMAHLPFMQFYPADWIQDTQTLNHQAKGAWIDLLCQMWLAPERGVLDWCIDEFTTLLRLQNDEETDLMVARLKRVSDIRLFDNDRNEVEKVEHATHIEIISRRIIRDTAKIKAKHDADLRYNEKGTRRKRSGNDQETTPIYQKSEVIYQRSEEDKIKTPIVPKGDDVRFEVFWKEYPNKTGKGAASKAWKKAKITTEVNTQILNALNNQKKSEKWVKSNGQFVPNPATWLNQARWEDEIPEDEEQRAVDAAWRKFTPLPKAEEAD